MQMVMSRKFMVQGHGHAVRFVKDEPVWVPPILTAECRKYGAVPADPSEDAGEASSEVDEPEFATPRDEPQGEDRERVLLQAIEHLVGQNNNNNFGANGAPKLEAVKDLVNFRIDAAERNAIWQLYNRRKHEALNPSNANEDAPIVVPDEVESNSA